MKTITITHENEAITITQWSYLKCDQDYTLHQFEAEHLAGDKLSSWEKFCIAPIVDAEIKKQNLITMGEITTMTEEEIKDLIIVSGTKTATGNVVLTTEQIATTARLINTFTEQKRTEFVTNVINDLANTSYGKIMEREGFFEKLKASI